MSACINLFSPVPGSRNRSFVGPFRFLPASPSFIPRAHSGIHSRGVLLAAYSEKSRPARALRREIPGSSRERQSPEFMTVALNVRPRRIHLGVYPRRRVRDSSTKAGAKFLYALPVPRARSCVNLHWHAWNYVAIVRATTRFPVSSGQSYQASSLRRIQNEKKRRNISRARPRTLPRDVCIVEHYRACRVSQRSLQCLRAINVP